MTRNTYMYTVSTTHLCPATTAIITIISKASIHAYDVALVQVVALTAM